MTDQDSVFTSQTNPNGTVHTYVNGQLHSVNDEPSKYRKIMGEAYWHNKGKLHRDGDKPALTRDYQYEVKSRDQKIILKEREWYKKGKKHRDGDKSALFNQKTTFYTDVKIVEIEENWYKNGKLHRTGDKPAAIITKLTFDRINGVLIKKAIISNYYKHGKKHRENNEPAYTAYSQEWDENRNLINYDSHEQWYVNNLLHRENDKPAAVSRLYSNKNERDLLIFSSETFYLNNAKHRDGDKPAVIEIRNDSSGYMLRKVLEYYYNGKKHHSKDEPSYVQEDYDEEGKVTNFTKVFHKKGQLHRDGDKPAYIYLFDGDEATAYFQNNLPHRETEPAVIIFYDNERLFNFYKEGEIIPPPNYTFFEKEILKYDPDFEADNINEFPVSQIISLLNALSTNGTYILKEIPVTYLNDIFYIR